MWRVLEKLNCGPGWNVAKCATNPSFTHDCVSFLCIIFINLRVPFSQLWERRGGGTVNHIIAVGCFIVSGLNFILLISWGWGKRAEKGAKVLRAGGSRPPALFDQPIFNHASPYFTFGGSFTNKTKWTTIYTRSLCYDILIKQRFSVRAQFHKACSIGTNNLLSTKTL